MAILGIDPGRNGGMAVISSGKLTHLDDFHGAMVELRMCLQRAGHIDLAIVEQQSYRPGQKGVAQTLVAYGKILGFLEALKIPLITVRPQMWQQGLGLPKRPATAAGRKLHKADIAQIVEARFPDAQIRTERGTLLDGRADAVMIALNGAKTA